MAAVVSAPVSVFAELVSRFPTWVELKTFLTSPDGGSLSVSGGYDGHPYELISYIKGVSDLTMPHVGAFRSVIWDIELNRPVSVAPFKSEKGESLPTEGEPGDYIIQKFHDGVMINVHWCSYTNKWIANTRHIMGAQCHFYCTTASFATLFWSTFNKVKPCKLEDKNATYSFVLQHHSNRIVCPVTEDTVYLVEKITIAPDASVTFEPQTSLVVFPTWESVENMVQAWDMAFKHTVQGLVVKTTDGRRWKLRTCEYNRIHELRTNNANLTYVWVEKLLKGQYDEYIALYSDEKDAAERTKQALTRLINLTLNTYFNVFIHRCMDKSDIPAQCRPFVYKMLTKYNTELKPTGARVCKQTAVDVIYSCDPAQLVYAINWKKHAKPAAAGAGAASAE
jgi:hypothetical protein